MRFEFSVFMIRKNDFNKKYNKGKPIPMRVMFGRVVKETEKVYIIEVYGKPEKAIRCLHCNRVLTNEVSKYYGIGPTCGKKYGIVGITEANLESRFDEIREKLKSVTWRGIVPKEKVNISLEDHYEMEFEYHGKYYRVKTTDLTKVSEIRRKSDRVLKELVMQC